MEPLLSILIPTVVGREKEFEKLFYNLKWQLDDDICSHVEIVWEKDNKEMTIGEKRELLYKKANGLFSVQVDDDDALGHGAIRKIVNVIRDTESVFPVNCITYRENCMINGKYYSSNHHAKYEKWQDNFDGFDFVRTPFYKDVIRTEIARSVPFPHIRYNEDEQWSYAIKPLLGTFHHIDEEIYFYIYEPKDTHEERYGIK